MDKKLFFLVNVCRRLVCAVYLVIVTMCYALLYTHYQHIIVTLDVAKWTYAATTEFKNTETLSNAFKTSYKMSGSAL